MKRISQLTLVAIASLYFSACGSSNKNLSSSIETKEVSYSTKKTQMKGYIATPNTNKKTPGILVVHEWWGHNEYARERAEKLAELGYTALAVDMYGDGKTAQHPSDAKKFAMATFKDPKEAKKKFMKALEVLKSHPNVDSENIAAIGYCFGGGVVLAMASQGVELDGVVSFHGSLAHIKKVKKGSRAKVLVLNGEADPMITKEHIKDFKKLMKKNKVDAKVINYPNALHAFTNPRATEVGKKFKLPLAYDEGADKDSWAQMQSFFKEIFSK